ncbi:MAG: hypothetical protein HOB45_04325 [Planctomycetaceae bacterium]|jgi:hypothetical protein|nr:hypothetical protein [Planctomycetaceae bacterium]
MKNYCVLLFAGLALLSTGCAKEPVGSAKLENIQFRLDTLSTLQDNYDNESLGQNVPKEIAASVDMLCDSESEKETLLALNEELKKNGKKTDEMQRILSEMSKVIKIPEKFNDSFPLRK